MSELMVIEYHPTGEDSQIDAAIENMEEVAESPYSETIEIQGWFSSIKKFAKKAVKKAVKTVVPAPIRKAISKVDKVTGGALSSVAKSALPAALQTFTSINPVTGSIMKLSTKMFDEIDTLGKSQGKKIAYSAKATGNVARTFYEKGRRDAETSLMKRLAKMDQIQINLLRKIAREKAPAIIKAQENAQQLVAQKQAEAGVTPAPAVATRQSRSRSRSVAATSTSRRRKR